MKPVRRRWSPGWAVLPALLLIFAWAISGLEANQVDLAKRWPQAVIIFRLMFGRVDWAFAWTCAKGVCESDLALAVRQSLEMAVVGTGVAAVLAVPFGFLAARGAFAGGRLAGPGKFLLVVIRAFPELILAILLGKALGMGPAAGAMAMGIHSIGNLAKLDAETVETIDRGIMEAMSAAGANRIQALWYGIVPQVLPEFASYVMYRFEINVRNAAVMGIIGAGGIGAPLIFAVMERNWGRVGAIIIGIVAVVGLVDTLSSWVRSKLV